ncbi:MAG: carbon-nitrogen hydrolase family protein [Halioglobus sp.]
MIRVAALQFSSGTDVDVNLATSIEMIERAGEHKPQVMVLPEFCNHISWYDDAQHAWDVSLDLDGAFLHAIAAQAARHHCHLVINVSLRRSDQQLTITSLMYGPDGSLLAQADKQTLMGHENFWFQRAKQVSPVLDTEVGRLAMFPCRDGVTFETPRGLALRGAQLFCDSLNSFALDEASLHVPARAPENRCFLVAANKVGPLIPQNLLQQVSEDTHIPLRFLYGAGESQIVSPQGKVLAKGPRDKDAVVWADIDLSQADEKRSVDGTDCFTTRRPHLYSAIATAPKAIRSVPAQSITVACLAPGLQGESAIVELEALIAELPADTRLAVLPELFSGMEWGTSDKQLEQSQVLIERLSSMCESRNDFHIVTSLPMAQGQGVGLSALLIGSSGPVATQGQLHASARFPGLQLAENFDSIDFSWGRLALLTADDMRHPEMSKLAAIEGVHLLVVPGKLLETWEATLALPSRAAENRICLAYSSLAVGEHGGMIADLHQDFTLMTAWAQRSFDGFINQPLITQQIPGQRITLASVNLLAANNKLMSEQTDLILDRPWELSGELIRESDND